MPDAYGPYKLGMTPLQVQKLGAVFDTDYPADGDCSVAATPEAALIFENGKLTRITPTSKNVRTEAGLAVGNSTLRDVLLVYGKDVSASANRYTDDVLEVTVPHKQPAPSASPALMFSFDKTDKLTLIEAGTQDGLRLVEGCL